MPDPRETDKSALPLLFTIFERLQVRASNQLPLMLSLL